MLLERIRCSFSDRDYLNADLVLFHEGSLNQGMAVLDWRGELKEDDFANLGAYWFRPDECARGGMPRMIRWPR